MPLDRKVLLSPKIYLNLLEYITRYHRPEAYVHAVAPDAHIRLFNMKSANLIVHFTGINTLFTLNDA